MERLKVIEISKKDAELDSIDKISITFTLTGIPQVVALHGQRLQHGAGRIYSLRYLYEKGVPHVEDFVPKTPTV